MGPLLAQRRKAAHEFRMLALRRALFAILFVGYLWMVLYAWQN